jgi:hypothetical protein
MGHRPKILALALAALLAIVGATLAIGSIHGPAGNPYTLRTCANYAALRPLVAHALVMDAEFRAGDQTGAVTDARAIEAAIRAVYPSMPSPDPKAPTPGQMLSDQVFQLEELLDGMAQGVTAGMDVSDLDALESELESEAGLLDNYATGSRYGPVCPGMSIRSPYPLPQP